MKKFYLLLIICLPIFGLLNNQGDRLIIEHADENSGMQVDGEQLRILKGNVHIRQDTLNMFCDQALFNENMSKLIFTGNVLIDNGHRRVTADKIDFYPDRNWADCFGNVHITSAKDSMFSDIFSYDFDKKNAHAEGNVYLIDRENMVQIWGEEGGYQSEFSKSYVNRNARLMKIDSSSTDTFTVQFTFFKTGKLRIFILLLLSGMNSMSSKENISRLLLILCGLRLLILWEMPLPATIRIHFKQK